jgi:hypothetical protein
MFLVIAEAIINIADEWIKTFTFVLLMGTILHKSMEQALFFL